MFETPRRAEVVILVYVTISRALLNEEETEFQELALSAGVEPVDIIYAPCRMLGAKYLIGSGKLEEIRQSVQGFGADLVIFNHDLTPAQVRNMEGVLNCRVIDRVDLILDIFAQRAQTFEGKLQVELAQLSHLSTRLVRGWSHLERQKGGIGLRGPGETQLEVDRRLIRLRIKSITDRLEKVRLERGQRRRTRHRANVLTIALVGYTNAGKSTLFNILASAEAYVADQLFATLDPTLRQRHIAELGKIVLADTVGFIRQLPPGLIDAFRATLEETVAADLLLHVVDAADSCWQDKMAEVNKVLSEIGADQVPQLWVFNKIDALHGRSAHTEVNAKGDPVSVSVSAKTGEGIDHLESAIAALLTKDVLQKEICLLSTQGKLRNAFYQLDVVISEEVLLDGSIKLVVRLPKQKLAELLREN